MGLIWFVLAVSRGRESQRQNCDAAYCAAWNTNGNDTSTEPPAGAGKRQREISDLIQLATSLSPIVSFSTSTPDTVPAAVIVQWMTTLPLRLGFRLSARS
jgi:hypothetical protein